jgi:hypothetical protein
MSIYLSQIPITKVALGATVVWPTGMFGIIVGFVRYDRDFCRSQDSFLICWDNGSSTYEEHRDCLNIEYLG